MYHYERFISARICFFMVSTNWIINSEFVNNCVNVVVCNDIYKTDISYCANFSIDNSVECIISSSGAEKSFYTHKIKNSISLFYGLEDIYNTSCRVNLTEFTCSCKFELPIGNWIDSIDCNNNFLSNCQNIDNNLIKKVNVTIDEKMANRIFINSKFGKNIVKNLRALRL